jgi:histidinol phosphatase-like PHP family hydrolase
VRAFRADLHIHTCLSPCADILMSPCNIAAAAKRKDLDLLGICDHNSAENAAAVAEAAGRLGIRVLPGLEVTSREEVHILALFDKVEEALSLQDRVYEVLPGENNEEVFGLQVVAGADDEVLGTIGRFLAGATDLSLEDVVGAVHALRGLAVASHVDREGFGILGQLGFIPEDLPLDALEISRRFTIEEGRSAFGAGRPLITGSDAHTLEEIGLASTSFRLETATVEEIGLALKGLGERLVLS